MALKYDTDSIYWSILDKGIKQGMVPGLEKKAREWYRKEAAKVKVTGDPIRTVYKIEPHMKRPKPMVGFMYQFEYDAKHKATLPYWDRCPLVFPYQFHKNKQGQAMMTGINLHYLNRPMRARLMDALHGAAMNKKYNDNQRLRISYDILSASAKYRWFEPTVHTYLLNRVRSPFYKVGGEHWDIALFLPTERFVKAPKTKVWADSAVQVRDIRKAWKDRT